MEYSVKSSLFLTIAHAYLSLGTILNTYIGAVMGRKKMKFYVTIPKSMFVYVSVSESGEAKSYKISHFLSILTHHIQDGYPNVGAFFFKDITSIYLKKHYTTDYLTSVITPLLADGIIEVDGAYSTDLHFPISYRLNGILAKEIIEGHTERVYFTNRPLINNIEKWRRGTLSRQIEKYSFIEKEAEMLLHLEINITTLEQLYSQRIEDIQQSNEKKKRLAITNATRHKEEILRLTEARDLLDARVRYISGRVYHPFVQCPREFRKAVVDEQGQPYEEVDLRSQTLKTTH